MSDLSGSFPPPGYRRWSENGTDVVATDDVAGGVARALEEAPSLARWAARHAERTARGGRGTLHVARIGDVLSAVRHYRRGGWMAPLLGDRYLDHPPRPFRELATSHTLRQAGVRTPRIVAAVVMAARVGYRADLATEWLEPGHDLEALLRPGAYPPGARTAALVAAGREIGRAHRAGLAHPDLQHRNLFVRPVGEAWEGWLLDLDRATIGEPGAYAGRAMARLDRSLVKAVRAGRIEFDESDREALHRGHDEGLVG